MSYLLLIIIPLIIILGIFLNRIKDRGEISSIVLYICYSVLLFFILVIYNDFDIFESLIVEGLLIFLFLWITLKIEGIFKNIIFKYLPILGIIFLMYWNHGLSILGIVYSFIYNNIYFIFDISKYGEIFYIINNSIIITSIFYIGIIVYIDIIFLFLGRKKELDKKLEKIIKIDLFILGSNYGFKRDD